jgi:hypothetical protein
VEVLEEDRVLCPALKPEQQRSSSRFEAQNKWVMYNLSYVIKVTALMSAVHSATSLRHRTMQGHIISGGYSAECALRVTQKHSELKGVMKHLLLLNIPK